MKLGPVRVLLFVILLLACGLGWMWFDQQGQLRNVTWVAPAALAPDLKGLGASNSPGGAQAINPTQFLAILERPIFAPDRRPPPPPAPPPPPDPMADVKIVGIFSGANAGVLAFFDGKVRRVKVNENIGAWTLKSVEGRAINFTQGDESKQLHLAYSTLGLQVPKAASTAAQSLIGSSTVGASIVQSAQEEGRERFRRANELRASRGLPVISQ